VEQLDKKLANGGDGMMSRQSELFDRAGQCELLMRSTTDLAKKEGLKQLRDFWIALANEVVNGSENHLREQIAAAQRIQAVFEDTGEVVH
jgi:hypothetical protein